MVRAQRFTYLASQLLERQPRAQNWHWKDEKYTLLKVQNPDYPKPSEMYYHLQGVELLETESEEEYPIPVILGASEYSN